MGSSTAEIQEKSVNRFPPIRVDRLAPRDSSDVTRFLFFLERNRVTSPRSRLRSRFKGLRDPLLFSAAIVSYSVYNIIRMCVYNIIRIINTRETVCYDIIRVIRIIN